MFYINYFTCKCLLLLHFKTEYIHQGSFLQVWFRGVFAHLSTNRRSCFVRGVHCWNEKRLTRHSQSSSWGSSPFSGVCIQDPRVPPPLPPRLSCRLCRVAGCSSVAPSWSCTGRQQGRRAAADTDTLPGFASSA